MREIHDVDWVLKNLKVVFRIWLLMELNEVNLSKILTKNPIIYKFFWKSLKLENDN